MVKHLRWIRATGAALGLLLFVTTAPEAKTKKASKNPVTEEARFAILQRAQVWTPVSVSEMDIRLGPQGKGAFEPDAKVPCDYVEQPLDGNSPKFNCRVSDGSVVKVKYGHGEVEAEILGTRLLWALGFGADRMYPAVVTCRGCAADPWKDRRPVDETHVFESAVIERKFQGHAIETKKTKGWAWPELNMVDARQGGAPAEQRNALALLAVFIQHSDSKPEQQRLTCLSHDYIDDDSGEGTGQCAMPFLLLNDVGQTFGKANYLNRSNLSAVNFDGWSKERIWRDQKSCVANLPLSRTGTLENPKISEAGRAFLAGLLTQLTDRQIHDLFEVARVDLRSRKPGSNEPPATIDEWVAAFKQKREEIVTRRCGA
jgi:hypothetical protein